jgi:hypothetical protein
MAATCPAVRVRIIRLNPIQKVGVASATTYRRLPGSVKPRRERLRTGCLIRRCRSCTLGGYRDGRNRNAPFGS